MNGAKWCVVGAVLSFASVSRAEPIIFDFESGDLSGWDVTGNVRLVREAAGIPSNGSDYFALFETTPEAPLASLRRQITVVEESYVAWGRFYAGPGASGAAASPFFKVYFGDPAEQRFSGGTLGFGENPDTRWIVPAGAVLVYPGTYTISVESGWGTTRFAVDNIAVATTILPAPGAAWGGCALACMLASRRIQRGRQG